MMEIYTPPGNDAEQESAHDRPASTETFLSISEDATSASRKNLAALLKGTQDLPQGGIEAAQAIRKTLIAQGYQYDERVFTAGALLQKRRGNCLGYAMLIGGMLGEKGYQPSFEIILHPKDAVEAQDEKLFQELLTGEHFDYENPQLPEEEAEHPVYRFAPLEHPVLILDGLPFETTSLEEEAEDATWSPPAERRIEATYGQLASNIPLDRAKILINQGGKDAEQIQGLIQKSIDLWQDNRSAWALLWELARARNDDALKEGAFRRYQEIGGDDSRYHYDMFRMTDDERHLDKALERFPAYIDPFIQKKVYREPDPAEARFNFAVAAWCVANSSTSSLKNFYAEHKNKLIALFGKERARELASVRRKR